MRKMNIFKTLLIPTLGITAIGTIAIVSTSCKSREKNVKITANEDSTLKLINFGDIHPILQYSTDENNWQNYEEEIVIPKGTSLYFKGYNPYGWSHSDEIYSSLNIVGNVSISGNIIGLLDNGKGTMFKIPNEYCFYKLFADSKGISTISNDFLPTKNLATACYNSMFLNCTSLTSAPELPATSLPRFCYFSMFSGCTLLANAPKLPATYLTSGCYNSMFENCTSLTEAPALPATTLSPYCYSYMFGGCTSLKVVPILPATELAEGCYYDMFSGCASLTETPVLPAITLANSCYSGMFYKCTNLTTVHELPATTLMDYCYAGMFEECTSLTSAPELPATTLTDSCYESMFNNCTSLNSIKISYTGTVADAPNGAFTSWVTGVAATGTFYYKGSDTLENFGFPTGWQKPSF